MNIHMDTPLLLTEPRWEKLAAGDHRFFVSSLAYAELAEAMVRARGNGDVSRRALQMLDAQSAYGAGIPFGDREAHVYRETVMPLAATSTSRRVDMMIAAVAISCDAALGTRSPARFAALEPILTIIEL